MKKKIEILAPAKDLIQGIAAINAGAAYTAISAGSTEGAALLTNLNAWLATTPAAPVLTYAV